MILVFPLFVDPGVMGPLYSGAAADAITVLVAAWMVAGVMKKLKRMQSANGEPRADSHRENDDISSAHKSGRFTPNWNQKDSGRTLPAAQHVDKPFSEKEG